MRALVLAALLLLTDAVNFFSLKQDIEIGTVSSQEAERTLPFVRDANVNAYLRSVGMRLTTTATLPLLQYRYRIVNSREINSLGFPGGAIYINRGLIELAASDDELAAIMSLEIGHVAARHGTAQLSRQLLVQAPISIAAGLPTMDAWKDQLTKLGISFGVGASFLRYSRDQELEADLMAVRLLADARFDPGALGTLLEKISEVQRSEEARLRAFVFNHPQPQNPSSEIADEIERLSSPQRRAHASPEFKTFLTSLRRVAYPSAEKEAPGTSPGDALANVFNHPLEYYRLGYPAGWQVTRSGTDGAIIAPAGGVVGGDLTHGVMFDMFDISVPDRALTLEQASNRLIVFLRQRNQSLRVVPGAQMQTLISDEPGLRTVIIGESSVTKSSEVVWVVTRLYFQSLFYMVFVAPEDEFPAYQPVFEQIIRSARLR